MALVTSFELREKERQMVHQPTRCYFSSFQADDGRRFIQLDTVGSDQRQITDKVSQSLQFDEDSARRFIELARQSFPNIA